MSAWELLWSKAKGIKISSDGIMIETDTLTKTRQRRVIAFKNECYYRADI